jgi:hypothetical protein
MLQQHDELNLHTSEYHAPVHGKYSKPQPIASKPTIRKSRRDSAAKPRSGRVEAVESDPEHPWKKPATSCGVLY